MDFGDLKNKVLDQKDQIKKGLTKAGDLAKNKYGHGTQIDQAEKKIDDYLDQQAAERQRQEPGTTGPTPGPTTGPTI